MDKRKKQVYDSRILTSRNLVDVLDPARNVTFVSASDVGYFGCSTNKEFTEEDGPGDDFLARVSRDWEAEAMKA